MTAPIGTIDLEGIAALGWQGTSTEQLGGWLLRAGSGFTGRANSVLPLGSPGCPVADALDLVTDFYRRHDLTPLFQVPLCPEAEQLDDDLERRGWVAFNLSWVLIADLDDALAHCPPGPGLPAARFDSAPTAEWLDGYLYRGSPLPDSAVAVLRNADTVVFATLTDRTGRAAVVRGAVGREWLGVTALTVDENRRRGGIGRHLMGELLRWAASRGAGRVYLQVAADNTSALGLYEALGFTRHHRYHYRRPGQQQQPPGR